MRAREVPVIQSGSWELVDDELSARNYLESCRKAESFLLDRYSGESGQDWISNSWRFGHESTQDNGFEPRR
jgi:hypothetical protein